MKKIIKKASIGVMSLGLLLGMGFHNPVSARPSCGCPNPNIDSWKVDNCHIHYICRNCGWRWTWDTCK
ncbi:hypothetical protein AAGC94_04695 [Clostridium sporogenes]|uniref:Uncharacterized protein n=1 Tax=Clostridium botulinum TaxID=1491 RepID=A0AAU8YWU9_CLOBO|nr:hypothetical protein [Clostridium sporogenes]AVP64781.1 hypothetical protein C3B64_11120 [Clostridium botulinum]EHN15298.1 hypothetical protein IYC_10554 [Clostridium sporogenes PA 3679]KOY66240.1 hypothetical protein AN649_09485 [Clostridium sporogenes]MBA4507477.1 hypothetical protein [Clostridium sporogenes]MBW5457664.1 hypothetical protein [Clostridium sporogenes]